MAVHSCIPVFTPLFVHSVTVSAAVAFSTLGMRLRHIMSRPRWGRRAPEVARCHGDIVNSPAVLRPALGILAPGSQPALQRRTSEAELDHRREGWIPARPALSESPASPPPLPHRAATPGSQCDSEHPPVEALRRRATKCAVRLKPSDAGAPARSRARGCEYVRCCHLLPVDRPLSQGARTGTAEQEGV